MTDSFNEKFKNYGKPWNPREAINKKQSRILYGLYWWHDDNQILLESDDEEGNCRIFVLYITGTDPEILKRGIQGYYLLTFPNIWHITYLPNLLDPP